MGPLLPPAHPGLSQFLGALGAVSRDPIPLPVPAWEPERLCRLLLLSLVLWEGGARKPSSFFLGSRLLQPSKPVAPRVSFLGHQERDVSFPRRPGEW
jgi:hypothetical protein